MYENSSDICLDLVGHKEKIFFATPFLIEWDFFPARIPECFLSYFVTDGVWNGFLLWMRIYVYKKGSIERTIFKSIKIFNPFTDETFKSHPL